MTSLDVTALCSNLTLFSQVVAVDDNLMDTLQLQQAVCSLNINMSVILHQLRQHWSGFAHLMDAVSDVSNVFFMAVKFIKQGQKLCPFDTYDCLKLHTGSESAPQKQRTERRKKKKKKRK